jgi:hypothetical protein
VKKSAQHASLYRRNDDDAENAEDEGLGGHKGEDTNDLNRVNS